MSAKIFKLFTVILGVLASYPAFARDFTYSYQNATLTYTVLDEDAKTCMTKAGEGQFSPGNKIKKYSLVIPEYASDGTSEYRVVKIGSYSFSNTEIGKVRLPESVVEIGDRAFLFSDLSTIYFHDAITEIGEEAFAYSELCDLVIPPSLSVISKRCFYSTNVGYWGNGGTVIIPPTVKKIEDEAFGQTPMSTIVIPSTVDSVCAGVFAGCDNLKTVEVNCEIETLPRAFFKGCTNLQSVSLPKTLKAIGAVAFSRCGFTTFTVPSTVQELGADIFAYCQNLTTMTLPDNLISLGDGAFYQCKALKEVNLGKNLDYLGEEVFYNCLDLEAINIPGSVSHIGNDCFVYCSKLNRIDVDPTNRYYGSFEGILYDKVNASLMKCPSTFSGSLTIPDYITSISEKAFYNCVNLNTLYLPRSLESVGDYAFENCSKIKDIYYFASPDLIAEGSKYSFELPVYGRCVLHFSDSMRYESLPKPWRFFLNIVYENFSGIDSPEIEPELDSPEEIYSINGTFVGNSLEGLSPGLYIIRKGNKVTKIWK